MRAILAVGLAAALPLIFTDLSRRDAAVRRRPVVPCTILSSGVDTARSADAPYAPSVSFAFDFAGRHFVGDRWSADDGLASGGTGGTTDAAEAYAAADRYPPGTRAACYVDPTDPGQSSLVQPRPAWEPWVLPTGWTLVAAVAVFYCWPQLRLAWRGEARRPPRPRRWWSGPAWGAVLFAGFGSVTAIWWGVPVARTAAARGWPTVPCTVELSRVQEQQEYGEVPLTLYRTDVLYRYAVGGRTYHSNQYSLTECASPAPGGRRAVVAAYSAGRTTECYVDPADPRQATLTRRVGPAVSFAAVPVLFTAVGLVMVLDAGRGCLTGPLGRLLRRRPWSAGTVGVLVLIWTAWGVFGSP